MSTLGILVRTRRPAAPEGTIEAAPATAGAGRGCPGRPPAAERSR
ncbi:hypothetical protein [Kocuria sp. CNJ-770]|nr:hypothetical protein [Kocuria sp. CNJ-770]